ncbi:competence protein CoiA [Liquorilactobacillus vini]|uniref:Competence protein transcription factor n=1 Tax=Liquorilactobacillus vini DSM 20605 TaxID=1133569 RepID=A0A0R2CLU8_9LACO|nr:competence protein CoiA family protein [Liquorilactobacillus vini]KRM88787.1 competence protein transcription factor [Liquorilactobacillus vini DSM 20605]
MLIAENSAGKKVTAFEVLNSDNHQFSCPICHGMVVLKRGRLRMPHFAHYHQCPAHEEGETVEHLTGKIKLLANFSQAGYYCKLEVYLPKIKQRPDLLVDLGDKLLAVEFQCAPLKLTTFKRRTLGYVKQELRYWWILGKRHFPRKKLTQQIAQFMKWHPNLGFYLIYYFSDQGIFILVYQIKQPDFLNLQYRCFKTTDLIKLQKFMRTISKPLKLSLQARQRQQKNFLKACSYCQGNLFQEQMAWYQQRVVFRNLGVKLLPFSLNYPLFISKQLIWQSQLLRSNYQGLQQSEALKLVTWQTYQLPLLNTQLFLKQSQNYFFIKAQQLRVTEYTI